MSKAFDRELVALSVKNSRVKPAGYADETAVRSVVSYSLGRELIAPSANISALAPMMAHVRISVERWPYSNSIPELGES